MNDRVLGRELMPIDTVRLGGVGRRNSVTTHNVLTPAHGFEVRRIDTRTTGAAASANVIDRHALGNRADADHVGHAMRQFELALVPEAPITGIDDGRLPQPTLIPPTHIDLRPEALTGIFGRGGRCRH